MKKDTKNLSGICNEVKKTYEENGFWTSLIVSSAIAYNVGALLMLLFK